MPLDYIIQTENLCRQFGKVRAVHNLSLNVPKGSVYGFLGPNGAGKTTTIKLLLGLTKPSSGSIRVLGQPAASRNYLHRIGFLPDVPNFYPWMRGDEFLTFAGQLFSIPPAELKKRSSELLEITGLKGVKTKIGGYSRGMKQRLGLAQALINQPDLVFMDEPTSALDPIGRKEILETISLISDRCTVFFSTHILTDVERVCDRVGILKQGELVTEETIEGLHKRFAKNAIRLEVTGDSGPFISALKSKKWVQMVEQQNGSILLTVFDLQTAQQEIPSLLSQHNLGLCKLEQVEMNLEDIFVRLVKP